MDSPGTWNPGPPLQLPFTAHYERVLSVRKWHRRARIPGEREQTVSYQRRIRERIMRRDRASLYDGHTHLAILWTNSPCPVRWQGVFTVPRLWLNCCHQFTNKALHKIKNVIQMIVSDGREPRSVKLMPRETTRIQQLQGSGQHLLNMSAGCTTTSKPSMDRTLQYSHTGIEFRRILSASDNQENRWNCGRDPSLVDVKLTFSTGLNRTSAISSVSGFPAQTAGGEPCPVH